MLKLPDDDEWKLAELYGEMSKVFTPIKHVPFHEWVEQNYILPPNLVPDAFRGLVSFDNAPYLRVIARAISEYKDYPGKIYQITIQKGSQVYITTIATAAGFYFIIVDPQKQLWIFPVSEKSTDWMKTSFKSSWREMPAAVKALGNPDNEKGQQAKLLEYTNGFMKLVTPKGGGALQGTPANIIIVDEPSSVDAEVNGLGDTINNLKGRPKNFSHALLFIGGTPGHVYYDDDGELCGGILTEEYHKSDQSVFHFPCPSCGHTTHYPITYSEIEERITYNVDANERLVDGSVKIVCNQCNEPTVDEIGRRQINIKFSGDSEYWKATNSLAPAYHRGFNINTFLSLSPQVSLDNFTKEFIECKSEKAKQAFCNTNGFPYFYSVGENLKDKIKAWERFTTKAVDENGNAFEFDVPMDVTTIVAAADIQDGLTSKGQSPRIEVVYVGFDIFGKTYVIDHEVFFGSLIKQPKFSTWKKCEENAPDGLLMQVHKRAIQRRFKHESRQEIGLSAFGFDVTNGSHSNRLLPLINDYPTFVGGTTRFRENPVVFGVRGDARLKNESVSRTGEMARTGNKRKPQAVINWYNRININTQKLTDVLYNDFLNNEVLFSDVFEPDFFDLVMTQIWSPEKKVYLRGEKNNQPNEVDDCICYTRGMLLYAAHNFGIRGAGKKQSRVPLIDVLSNEHKYNSITNRQVRMAAFCKRHGIKVDEGKIANLTLTEFQPLSEAMIKATSGLGDGNIDTTPIVEQIKVLGIGLDG